MCLQGQKLKSRENFHKIERESIKDVFGHTLTIIHIELLYTPICVNLLKEKTFLKVINDTTNHHSEYFIPFYHNN